MSGSRLDVEHGLTRQGRENVALTILAAGCVAGIVLISRVG
jgi:hypothetical protein